MTMFSGMKRASVSLRSASVIVLALLVAPATQARPLGTSSASCAAGVHPITIQGKSGYEFCGSATAVAHVGSKTVSYKGGLCRVVSGYFVIGIGKEALGLPPGSRPTFFGITTHKATPGPQPNAGIAITFGGQTYAVTHQIVNLAPGLKRGTFSGLTFGSHLKVSGSFTC